MSPCTTKVPRSPPPGVFFPKEGPEKGSCVHSHRRDILEMLVKSPLERFCEDQEQNPRGRAQESQKHKELILAHFFIEAADLARGEIAQERRQEPHPHQHRNHPRRRHLGHQGKTDRRQIKFAQGQ